VKVIATIVGSTDPRRIVTWPEGWPVPREGDSVTLHPDDPAVNTVRTVVWYPESDGDIPEPFVYLVLGSDRR